MTRKPRETSSPSVILAAFVFDLLLYAGSATKIEALVARDKRLLNLSLTLPKAVSTWRLVGRDSKLVGHWLSSSP